MDFVGLSSSQAKKTWFFFFMFLWQFILHWTSLGREGDSYCIMCILGPCIMETIDVYNSLEQISLFWSSWPYWVTQKLPQICTVILRICIGKVAWFAVYICGNFWVTQYVIKMYRQNTDEMFRYNRYIECNCKWPTKKYKDSHGLLHFYLFLFAVHLYKTM